MILARFVVSPLLALVYVTAGCSSSTAPSATEPHDAGGSSSAASSAMKDAGARDVAPPAVKRVFVTSGMYAGDLATEGDAGDGLSGGDAICNSLATAASLGGTWVAWLSTSTTSAASRVDLTAVRVLVDGKTKVFEPAGSDGLVSLAPLTLDEMSENLPTTGDGDGFDVWTATDGVGKYETQSSDLPNVVDDGCKGWTSASSGSTATEGELGAVASSSVPDSNWTDGSPDGFDDCSSQQRLYCFEQ